jgi:hypothetical protein
MPATPESCANTLSGQNNKPASLSFSVAQIT